MMPASLPDVISNEVSHILQKLSASWPMFSSLKLNHVDDASQEYPRFDRFGEAIMWLGDRGLINYESLLSAEPVIELRGAAITARGRDFLHQLMKPQQVSMARAWA